MWRNGFWIWLILLWAAAPARPAAAYSLPPMPLAKEDLTGRVATVTKKTHPGADLVVVFKGTQVRVAESGSSMREEEVVVKALTMTGAGKRSVLRFDYDPTTSSLEVLRVRLVRASGKIEEVDLAGMKDLPAPKRGIYWPFRVLLVEIPELLPGDAVAYQTRFSGFQIAYLAEEERFVPPMRGEFYDVVLFGGAEPVVEQGYELIMPRDKPVQFEVVNGGLESAVTLESDRLVYRFGLEKIPAYPTESAAPAHQDSVPKVVLATLADWQEKSRWFYLTNEPSFVADPAIREKVALITGGMKRDLDKITALNRWVAHNIRYSGLSMGPGEGYTLHPGTMTFQDRCGVCKDKAGMLVTMMRAAGFEETYAAMTMAGARVESIPADQFNHSVVAWRPPGGGFVMLDPTWAPLSRLNWSNAEAEQHYVVGTPAGDVLSMTPAQAPDANTLEVKLEWKLDDDGETKGKVHISGTGYMDTALRRWFGFARGHTWRTQGEDLVRRIRPDARLSEFPLRRTDVEDLDEPFELELEFRSPAAAPPSEKTLVLRPASFGLFVHGSAFAENVVKNVAQSRKRGLRFRCAKEIRYTERIKLPRAMTLDRFENLHASNDLGEVKAAVSVDGRWLTVTLLLRFNQRVVPHAQLAEYAALMQPLLAAQSAYLVLRGKE